MAGTFEVYKDAGGKHRFRLKASNGQVIASSQATEQGVVPERSPRCRRTRRRRVVESTPDPRTRRPDALAPGASRLSPAGRAGVQVGQDPLAERLVDAVAAAVPGS